MSGVYIYEYMYACVYIEELRTSQMCMYVSICMCMYVSIWMCMYMTVCMCAYRSAQNVRGVYIEELRFDLCKYVYMYECVCVHVYVCMLV